MKNTLYRAQILLEPEQHKALAEIARREDRSISDVVRTALREWLKDHQEDESIRQRMQALEVIRKHRQEMFARHGGQPLEIDVAALIEISRQERTDELFGRSFNPGN
jgi:Arc/MetJ-type ribon-helix-helix transcriptional regulator